jgi:hypothetical protein
MMKTVEQTTILDHPHRIIPTSSEPGECYKKYIAPAWV